jgi:hypothetical protein
MLQWENAGWYRGKKQGYSKGNKISLLKMYLYSDVHCSIFHNNQDMNQLKYQLVNEWMQNVKHTLACTPTGILFSLKKETLSFAKTWINPRGHYDD